MQGLRKILRNSGTWLTGAVLLFLPQLGLAANTVVNKCPSPKTAGGLLTGVSPECMGCGQCQIVDFFIVGNTVTKLILGLSGSVMLLMIIYGGFLWLSSAGESKKIDAGKDVLKGAIIGILIVFGAYTATQFLVAGFVCGKGSDCSAVVNEIFSRPFQSTGKKSSGGTQTTTTTPSLPTNPNSTNPTAGTPATN